MTQPPIDLAPLAADALLADPRLGAALAASDRPLALLPVRLETRYAAAANGTGELLVRIYPDQLQVDAHDPRLSTAEQGAGLARQFALGLLTALIAVPAGCNIVMADATMTGVSRARAISATIAYSGGPPSPASNSLGAIAKPGR